MVLSQKTNMGIQANEYFSSVLFFTVGSNNFTSSVYLHNKTSINLTFILFAKY